MTPSFPPIRMTGAMTLRDGELQHRSLAIANGRITKGPLPEVDLTGYLILPGIIDLHGDAFERHIAPRPSAPFPLHSALKATDTDAASNGITTAWMAQSWSWEGKMRSPEACVALLTALETYRAQAATDLRVQIRCETHTVETREHLLATIQKHSVDYVVFNNHLDEALTLSLSNPHEIALWAEKSGRSAEEHMRLVQTACDQAQDVPRYLCALAETFDTLGVTYGSHDDPDGETREAYSMIGAKICEFPTTRSAAALARAVGDPVLMGAPNVVRGGSQSGNIAAITLIEEGLCDALVSDYYYPALAQAALHLVQTGILDLPQAWAMISSKPAEILGLPDRGLIDYGKRADLTILNATTHQIEATIANGRLSHLTGEAANRFLCAGTENRFAAE